MECDTMCDLTRVIYIFVFLLQSQTAKEILLTEFNKRSLSIDVCVHPATQLQPESSYQ